MGAGFGVGINGFYVSLLTLAPAYTGILSSIQMVVGFTGMIVTPLLVSFFRVYVSKILFFKDVGKRFRDSILFPVLLRIRCTK
jgi:hypothetical protein